MEKHLHKPINLQGVWRFKLDGGNVGLDEKWYNNTLENTITLPGILQSQGYGNKISADTPFIEGLHDRLWFLRDSYKEYADMDDAKIPFLSQPVRHYTGAAWYQTDIDIPQDLDNKRITLRLERTRWKSSVWLDDTFFGDYDSLCAAHNYDFGRITPGRHVLTVRVDNSMIFPYRPDAHAVSDSVGNTWNGITGRIELVPTALIWLDDVSVYPDYRTKSVTVRIKVKNIGGQTKRCSVGINEAQNILAADISDDGAALEYTLQLGENASLWDEFDPVLHRLDISLSDSVSGELFDFKTIKFGLRNIEAKGRNFIINGRKVSFRGTHDAGCFPLTGYPATDIVEWRRIMSICKDWGLNHIRFHSWCPPEAAFDVADELGIYLQIECGMWNYFVQGGVIEEQLHIETDRIIKAYGNHASFVLFSSGNEPHGDYKPCLKEWVAKYRAIDDRHLYCVQSGWFWPAEPEPLSTTDYFYTCSRGPGRMRGIHGWFGKDYSQFLADLEAPFLSHELGQHCAYPDFSIINKFTGYLRPENYRIFRDSMEKYKLLHKNADFVMASGILQAAAYKEEVEANLRTYGYSGFSLLDLHDYLGQGGALVGLLDAFWEQKPYIKPEQFRRFCASVVPLARVYKSVYKSGEKLSVDLEVSCFDKQDLTDAVIYWKIVDEKGGIVNGSQFEPTNIPTGGNTVIGKIEVDLKGFKTPAQYRLIIGIDNTSAENDWKFWVYPSELDFSKFRRVRITSDFGEAMTSLEQGERVLFLPETEKIDFNSPPLSVTPIFWNTQMGPKWTRSLGLWCDTKHPALSLFPTSCGMEWQWNEIVKNARGLNIESLPDEIEPFIQPIDDWNRNYKLSLMFEARIKNGTLVVCSADLRTDLDNRPAAGQLLYSVLEYMNSDNFNPKTEITANHIESLLFDTAVMKKLNAKARLVNGEETVYPVNNIIDGDPNTYWLAGGKYSGCYPFEIEIEIEKPIPVKGISVMPRQDQRDAEGAIKGYEIYTSADGCIWNKTAEGEFSNSYELKKIYFEKAVELKKLHLKLINGFGCDNAFYWVRQEKTGFTSKYSNYQDVCAALAEVLFITDKNTDIENTDNVRISYIEGTTASEEIY